MEDTLEATVKFNKNLANIRKRLLTHFNSRQIQLARKRPLLQSPQELLYWYVDYTPDPVQDMPSQSRRGRRPKEMIITDPNEKTFTCPGECKRVLPISRKYAREKC
jgi:hypothetical protein